MASSGVDPNAHWGKRGEKESGAQVAQELPHEGWFQLQAASRGDVCQVHTEAFRSRGWTPSSPFLLAAVWALR